MLLAYILSHRPERFLQARDPESFGPVVDYHVLRTNLRTGLVEVEDSLAEALVARRRVLPEEEEALRAAAAEAMEALHRASGVSHVALDALFFAARRTCPEASEPLCTACLLDSACAHRTELFQPVLPTTAY
jgi:hypothetical protein